jgi:hypothetical protein
MGLRPRAARPPVSVRGHADGGDAQESRSRRVSLRGEGQAKAGDAAGGLRPEVARPPVSVRPCGTFGGGDKVERLSKRSKWQQQREGRPMGPNVYPDLPAVELHARREAEQRRGCSDAATDAVAPGAGAT